VQQNAVGFHMPASYFWDESLSERREQEAQRKQRNSASAEHVYPGWPTDRAIHRTSQNRRCCTTRLYSQIVSAKNVSDIHVVTCPMKFSNIIKLYPHNMWVYIFQGHLSLYH